MKIVQLKQNNNIFIKCITKFIFVFLVSISLKANDNIVSNSILAGFQAESLSNNYSPWSSYYMEYFFEEKNKYSINLKAETLSRYDLYDKKAQASMFFPFVSNWQWNGHIAVAKEGIVVPKYSIYNKLTYSDFINLSVSMKNNKYASKVQNNIYNIGLVKYVKNLRFSYDLYQSQVIDAGNSTSHKLTTHYFYNDHYTAFSYATGKEIEALDNGLVLSSDVDTIVLYGKYFLAKQWACNYSFNYVKHGDLYVKKGISFAIIYHF